MHLYGSDIERGRRERAELFTEMVASGVSNTMLSGQPNAVPALLEALVAHNERSPLGEPRRAERLRLGLHRPALLGRGALAGAAAVRQDDGRAVARTGTRLEYAVVHPIPNAAACVRCHGDHTPVNGWLDLRFTRDPIEESESRLAKTLLLTASGALVCLLGILLWLLGREAVSPLQRLVGAMRRAEAGELTVRADEGRPDELGIAARGFDAMLAALRRSQAELEAFYRERMVRADRFAAVGEIATGLAHEIKNPLAGLSGALELLAEDLAANPQHAEVVGEMRHQVQRLTHTMESLLSFARPPKAKLRSTDVNATLEKVLFLIRQQARNGAVAVDPELAPDLPPVLADPVAARAGVPQHLPQRLPGDGRPERRRAHASARGPARGTSSSRSATPARASRRISAPRSSSRSSRRSARGTGSASPSPPASWRSTAATSVTAAHRREERCSR